MEVEKVCIDAIQRNVWKADINSILICFLSFITISSFFKSTYIHKVGHMPVFWDNFMTIQIKNVCFPEKILWQQSHTFSFNLFYECQEENWLSNYGSDISLAKLVILETGLWFKQNRTRWPLYPCPGVLVNISAFPLAGRRMVSPDSDSWVRGPPLRLTTFVNQINVWSITPKEKTFHLEVIIKPC